MPQCDFPDCDADSVQETQDYYRTTGQDLAPPVGATLTKSEDYARCPLGTVVRADGVLWQLESGPWWHRLEGLVRNGVLSMAPTPPVPSTVEHLPAHLHHGPRRYRCAAHARVTRVFEQLP